MSINSISSSQALYESLLKKTTAKSQTEADNAYAKSLAAQTDASTEQAKPTAADIKSLLARLTGSQPSLMDFLSDDSSSTDDAAASFGSLDPLSGLGSLSGLDSGSDDTTSYDPISQMLKAFSGGDSSSSSDSQSSDPFSSLMSSIGSSLSPTELSNMLDKAYSQSSQEAQSEVATGQIVDKKK